MKRLEAADGEVDGRTETGEKTPCYAFKSEFEGIPAGMFGLVLPRGNRGLVGFITDGYPTDGLERRGEFVPYPVVN